MPRSTFLFSLSSLLTCAAAQLPTDSVLVIEAPGPTGIASYVIADSRGGGSAQLNFSSPFFFDAPAAVALDPATAGEFYALYDTSSLFPGILSQPIGLMGLAVGQPNRPWTQPGGDRMDVGATRIFTLRTGGIVEATPKSGTAPQVLLTQPTAVDLAVAGSFLYIACANAVAPAPLIELSLLTGVQRTVGNYTDVTCVAKAENSAELAVGTANGQILELDLATGVVLNTLATGAAVLAADYTAAGDLVWAIPLGPTYEIRSQSLARPLHIGGAAFRDLAVSSVPTASSVAFGDGCGALTGTAWFANSLPTPGNAGYALEAYTNLPNVPVLLFAGDNRLQSSVLAQPLPFDLSPLGASGCRLLVDPIASGLQTASSLGIASLALPIPAGAALIGAEFSVQAFTPDAGVQPLGFAAAPGLALRIF